MAEQNPSKTFHRPKSAPNAFSLPNGKRVPVLFRLKNVQQKTVEKIVASSPVAPVAEEKVSLPSTPLSDVPVGVTESDIAGPSWMRRNAYRMTVLVLLFVTIGLLYHNQQPVPSESSSQVALNTELASPSSLQNEAADNVDLASVSTIEEEISPQQEVLAEPNTVAAQVVSADVTKPANQAISNTNILKTSESEYSRTFELSPEVEEANAEFETQSVAEESEISFDDSSFASTTSTPVQTTMEIEGPTLLKPEEPSQDTLVNKAGPDTNLITSGAATYTQTHTIVNQHVQADTASIQTVAQGQAPINLYKTAESSTAGNSESGSNAIRETANPDMNPTELYSILKNFEQQQTADALRASRPYVPVSTSGNGATPTTANQWSSNSAPQQPMAAPMPPQGNQYPQSNMSTYVAPQNQALGSQYAPPAQQANVPQQMPRTPQAQYAPAFPQFQSPTSPHQDPSLYPVATAPGMENVVMQPATAPQKPAVYQPVFPGIEASSPSTVPYSADSSSSGGYIPSGQTGGYGFSR